MRCCVYYSRVEYFFSLYHIGEKTIHVEDFLGKKVDIDFMFFTADFIYRCLKNSGFEKIEIIEREPYPGVEYQSRRAYTFARKPKSAISLIGWPDSKS